MARTDYGAILSTVIKDTSDAIREVKGTNTLISPAEWGNEIRSISAGGEYKSIWDGTLIYDTYINYGDGEEVPYNSWSSTDFLDLSESTDGNVYRAGYIDGATYCAFYDASKNYVAPCNATDDNGGNVIPDNAKYVRFSTVTNRFLGVIFVKV